MKPETRQATPWPDTGIWKPVPGGKQNSHNCRLTVTRKIAQNKSGGPNVGTLTKHLRGTHTNKVFHLSESNGNM